MLQTDLKSRRPAEYRCYVGSSLIHGSTQTIYRTVIHTFFPNFNLFIVLQSHNLFQFYCSYKETLPYYHYQDLTSFVNPEPDEFGISFCTFVIF